jgi:hypothetical protein
MKNRCTFNIVVFSLTLSSSPPSFAITCGIHVLAAVGSIRDGSPAPQSTLLGFSRADDYGNWQVKFTASSILPLPRYFATCG